MTTSGKEAATRFLSALDPTAEKFTFQLLDPNRLMTPGIYHLGVDELGKLKKANDVGYDIYVTVNETDLEGRELANIVRPRALWQEDDGDGKPTPLQPHIVVQTSPGHFHRYWKVNGETTLEDTEGWTDVMVKQYGSDPGAKGRNRVLRVPGFFNHKRNCSVDLLVADTRRPFKREELVAALGEPPRNGHDALKGWKARGGELPVSEDAPPENWLDLLPMEAQLHWNGLEPLNVDDSKADHAFAKELFRVHPDGEWVMQNLHEASARWRNDPQKLDRASYMVPTLLRAWAEVQAERNVVEDFLDLPTTPPEPETSNEVRYLELSALFSGPKLTPPKMLVEGLISPGFTLFGSDPKVGKSRLLTQLMVRFDTGTPFFGRRVEQGRVLYYAVEDPGYQLQERVLAYGVPSTGGSVIRDMMPKGLKELDDDIVATGAKYIFIDTLARFLPYDLPSFKGKNAYEKDMLVIEPLAAICKRRNVSIIATQHMTKLKGSDPFTDMQGSMARIGIAEGMMVLTRMPHIHGEDRPLAELHVRGRGFSDSTLTLREAECHLYWEEADVGPEYRKQQILDLLSLGGESARVIAASLSIDEKNIYRYLRPLQAEGRIRKRGQQYQLVPVSEVS